MSLTIYTSLLASLSSSVTEITDSVDTMLGSLDEKAATLGDSWKDLAGETYISNYSTFLADTRTVCTELKKLAAYAAEISEKYGTEVDSHEGRVEING